ncbi:13804_t:CDS:2, partial [Cetraspora pellucida]
RRSHGLEMAKSPPIGLHSTILQPKAQLNARSNINSLDELDQNLKLLKCDFPLQTADKEFKGSKFGSFICYTFPTASFERRCLAIDFVNWSFFVDDLVDSKKYLRNPRKIKKELDKFLTILDNKPQEITNEEWQLNFRNSVSLYFDACYLNALNKCSQDLPKSVEEYLKIRRNSGGVLPVFDFIEPLLGIKILCNNLDLKIFINHCIDHICFINDLYSIKKELTEGEVDNIVVVLQYANQYSLQEAIDYAVMLTNNRMTQIKEVFDNSSRFSLEMDDHNTIKYVNALI